MLSARFITNVEQLRCANTLLKRRIFPEICATVKNNKSTWVNSKANPDQDMEDLDRPIKYSTSEAARWRIENVRKAGPPWYQGLVVAGSLTVFLLYFTVLREENDIDEKFDKLLVTYFEEHDAQLHTPNTKGNLPKRDN